MSRGMFDQPVDCRHRCGCFRHQMLLRGCGQWCRCGRERVARPSEQENLLALVALPTREQVYSSEPYGPGFDIDFPQAYLQLFAREQRIPYLDLLPIFREHVSRTNENIYVKGDTHQQRRACPCRVACLRVVPVLCQEPTHRQDLDRTEKPHR